LMMPRTLSLLGSVAVAVAVMALGCVATDVANRYYGTERYPAKDPRDVEILWERPSRRFTVIADFQSRGESPEAVRSKAAEIGADAVIISVLGGTYDVGEQWAQGDRYRNTYSRIIGTAIRFKLTDE